MTLKRFALITTGVLCAAISVLDWNAERIERNRRRARQERERRINSDGSITTDFVQVAGPPPPTAVPEPPRASRLQRLARLPRHAHALARHSSNLLAGILDDLAESETDGDAHEDTLGVEDGA